MKKRAFGAVVVLGSASALAWSVPAAAQEWLRDRGIAEGGGYRAGDFDVHPGLGAEVGYDSNYLGRSDKTGSNLANGAPANPPIETGELHVTPSLSIETTPHATGGADGQPEVGPPVAFGLFASGTYREFFAPPLQNQRNMSINAGANLKILPGREWNGSITGTYTRMIQPTINGDPDQSYNNDLVTATADIATQPNLGTLDWHFGYIFTGTFFEQQAGNPYNNLLNTGYTRGRWRFRPRTALLYDGQVSIRSYQDSNSAAFLLHQSTPVRARIGLEGLVTPQFSILGMIGYGATLANGTYSGDPTVQQYDSIIGTLELRFFPGGQPSASADTKPSLLVSTIALGYNRDFQASYLNDFFGVDRGYLKAEYFFGGKFLITLQGGVAAYEHPDIYFGPGAGGGATELNPILMAHSYTSIAADATLFAEYRILSSLAINATGTYAESFSDTQLQVAPNNPNYYDLNIRRITAFFGVRWFM